MTAAPDMSGNRLGGTANRVPCCPASGAMRCVCGGPTGLVAALSSEVQVGCPARVDHRRSAADFERLVRSRPPSLTPAARRLFSTCPHGGTPANIAAFVASGRLVLVEARAAAPRAGLAPRKVEPPPPVVFVEAPKATSWIKFQVVHHSTGEPFVGVRLSVRIPSGLELACETDANGRVNIDDIDLGACDLWCSLKEARLARTVAFVGLGEPPVRDPLAAGNAPLRSKWGAPAEWIAHVDEHKVRSGESLKSIAARYSYTWRELAEFNWGTAVPDEINKRLRDDVGCTVKTPDGMNYRFSDDDEPGLIYVPRPWWQQGLETEQTHIIRVRLAAGFRLVLENQDELRIPEAEYEATMSDGSVRKGRLGRGGVALIKDPPPGPVEVGFPDMEDVEAKSLAACAHRALTTRKLRDLFRVMQHEPWMLRRVIEAYDRFYNCHTGGGLLTDIEHETTDAGDRSAMSALFWLGRLAVDGSAQAADSPASAGHRAAEDNP